MHTMHLFKYLRAVMTGLKRIWGHEEILYTPPSPQQANPALLEHLRNHPDGNILRFHVAKDGRVFVVTDKMTEQDKARIENILSAIRNHLTNPQSPSVNFPKPDSLEHLRRERAKILAMLEWYDEANAQYRAMRYDADSHALEPDLLHRRLDAIDKAIAHRQKDDIDGLIDDVQDWLRKQRKGDE